MKVKVKCVDLFRELPNLIVSGKILIEDISRWVRVENRSSYVAALRRYRAEENMPRYKEVIKLIRQDAALTKNKERKDFLNNLAEQLE